MGDGEQGGALFADEAEDEVYDFAAGFGVEVSGGFVGKEDAGAVDQGAGNGDALLFATAQFGWQMVGAVSEAGLREQRGSVLMVGAAADHAGQKHIFECGEFGEEGVALKDESHARVAQPRLAAGGNAVKRLVFEMDFAMRGGFQTGERVEQRAFSSAGRAAEKDGFAAPDGEIHAPENFEGCAPEAEGFAESAGAQVDVGHGGAARAGSIG